MFAESSGAQARLALIARAGFEQVEVVGQVFQMLAQLGDFFEHRFLVALKVGFSSWLVIRIFPVADLLNHNHVLLDIEQDSVVAHPQAIADVRVLQPLDVTMQAVLQSCNPAKNLADLLFRQGPAQDRI